VLAVRVVVTGSSSHLGRRVVDALRAAGAAVFPVEVADDPETWDDGEGPLDVLVDLGSSDHDRLAARRQSATEHAVAALDAADLLDVERVVFVSSAMVYGPSVNNQVPLTEEAVLRPDVEFVFARQLATAEATVDEWRQARPDRHACVLRPAVAVAHGAHSTLAAALVAGLGRRFAELDPPAQFLHLDDLAAAIVRAVSDRLDGVYNVAPDGWVAGERVRALSGEGPRLPMPERAAELVGRLRWRFLRGPISPGLRSYTRASWVVSNGKLRATGWRPTVTNEQAYVEATDARWWTMLSPKRRQELSLGAGAVVLATMTSIAVLVVRRILSRR
jgi:nucleoside-diphosphate-sugar epimerase